MRAEGEHAVAIPQMTRSGQRPAHPVRLRLAQWLSSASIPLALAAVSFVVFSPALLNGFVKWDDDVNLLDNAHYRGLGWPQIRWMFTTTLTGHYIPVSWLSFGLDYTLWGMNPLGYHLTNGLLHASNAALFYLVAHRLLARATSLAGSALRTGSAIAALVFALHPLRVESVAWVTERRDVLSGLFFLVAVLMYLRAAQAGGRSRRRALAASLACYGLALLSKSIVMALPLVLVLLDVYPLGRLPWRWGAWRDGAARAVIREKVPYLVLGLAGAVTSYWAVASNHFLTPLDKHGWPARIAMAGYSLWFYVEKTGLPVGLSPLHELPAVVNPFEPRFLLSGLAVLAISVLVLALRRRWPAGLAAWVYYGVVLGPVSGIVHSGHQLTHDRYSYLSCLGWALVVGGGLGTIAQGSAIGGLRPWLARTAAAAAAVWILALGTLTWHQIPAWRNTESLWRTAVEADPACALCQANLGEALQLQDLLPLARERYELALALRPDSLRARRGLGLVLLSMGESEAALGHLRIALARHPADPESITAMAFALLKQKRQAEAIPLLERAIRIDPGYFHGHANLGAAFTETGQPESGIAHLLRAIELRPHAATPHLNLTRTYLSLGRYEAAREQYEILVRLDPELARTLAPALSSTP